MSLPPLVATFSTLVLSIIADGIAMSKPLVSLEGFYDLHLFPEKDRFDYTVSETHKASQAMHLVAIVSLMMALFLSVANAFMVSAADATSRAAKRLTILTTAVTALGVGSYLIAMVTLLKVALDYKHIADDIPLPTPKVHIESGAIMDIVGVFAAMSSFMLVMWAVVRSDRQGYLRII
jgi:hypothetical protein